MANTLYVVGTPIGNLSDFSPRAVETLERVDFIAAEDTRVTLKLLNHFNIKKPLISYYEHNKAYRGEEIIKRLMNGEDCAIVSDAGMPCISDPGEELIKDCAEKGIRTVVIPGPTALISALAISGLRTNRFTFEGFLSTNRKNRQEHLNSLLNEKRTMIFYEAPHKIINTLNDLYDTFGNRKLSIVREITKIHEEVIRTTTEEAKDRISEHHIKGEIVLVLEGKPDSEDEAQYTLEDAVSIARDLISKGYKTSDAAKETSKITDIRKNDIYKELL